MRDQPFDLSQLDRTDVTALKAAGEQLWYTFHLVMQKYPMMESHELHITHLQQFMQEIITDERRFSRSLIDDLFGEFCDPIEDMGDYWRVWPMRAGLDAELRKAARFALSVVVVCHPFGGGNDYVLTPARYNSDTETEDAADDQ